MTALQELLAKVKAGDGISSEDTGHVFDSVYHVSYALNADYGSLDAAKALHEAVLPDWGRSVDATAPEMGVEVKLHSADSVSIGDHQPTEARAWLIAIIEALIAQEQAT